MSNLRKSSHNHTYDRIDGVDNWNTGFMGYGATCPAGHTYCAVDVMPTTKMGGEYQISTSTQLSGNLRSKTHSHLANRKPISTVPKTITCGQWVPCESGHEYCRLDFDTAFDIGALEVVLGSLEYISSSTMNGGNLRKAESHNHTVQNCIRAGWHGRVVEPWRSCAAGHPYCQPMYELQEPGSYDIFTTGDATTSTEVN